MKELNCSCGCSNFAIVETAGDCGSSTKAIVVCKYCKTEFDSNLFIYLG